jgi:hypothetical protein
MPLPLLLPPLLLLLLLLLPLLPLLTWHRLKTGAQEQTRETEEGHGEEGRGENKISDLEANSLHILAIAHKRRAGETSWYQRLQVQHDIGNTGRQHTTED